MKEILLHRFGNAGMEAIDSALDAFSNLYGPEAAIVVTSIKS